VARLVFLSMIASGTLTAVVGSFDDHLPTWSVLVVVALSAACFAAMHLWRSAGPFLLAHPSVLFVFLLSALCVVPAVGASSPFTFMIIASCLLAGLLYDWRGHVLFPSVATGGWWAALAAGSMAPSLGALLAPPALVVFATVGGAAQRRLLDRQALVERRLRETSRAAARAAERTQLARDMHDSVVKTLYGVSLHAEAIVGWAERDPGTVAVTARRLASEASDAARRVREVIGELRAAHDGRTVARRVAEACREWSAATGTPVSADLGADGDAACGLPAESAAELCMVLGEALENVRRHADASAVAVGLRAVDAGVELEVADDGRGLDPGVFGPDGAPQRGRYGIVGMRERAERLGGRLTVERAAPGTRVRLWLPHPAGSGGCGGESGAGGADG
jgi:signal transduction histidine kinase